jgi:hypothetical protein
VKELRKAFSQVESIVTDENLKEIELPLDPPRLITLKGKDKEGKEIEWHLKVTPKGRLILV